MERKTQSDVNLFEQSIKEYRAAGSGDMEKKRKSQLLRSLLIRSVVIALCIGLLGYSVYSIADTFINNYRSEQAYAEIRAEDSISPDYVKPAEDMPEPNHLPTVLELLDAGGEFDDYVPQETKTVSSDTGARYKRIYRNFLAQADLYPDMYAWIYMTDTNINYPVMKSDDNNFYLLHNYKGETFRAGSIMADYRTGDDFYSNRNVIIYGHNMKNGSMFRSLKVWCGSAASKKLTSRSQIEIYTREGVYIYKILSYYIDDKYEYERPFFKSTYDYLNYLDMIYDKSIVKTKRAYDEDSRICTLVTCTNGTDGDSRHIVHGIFDTFYTF